MTAAALEGAAELVDDQGGQGFAFDFLADDEDRLAGVEHLFEDRHQVLVVGDFLLVDEDVRIFEIAFHLLRVGDEVRRQVAAVELHAFDELVVVSVVLPSSTVMTPSLPTLSIASAMILPISMSLLAAMVATFSRSFFALTGMLIFLSFSTMSSTAFSMPRFMSIGLTPRDDGAEPFVVDRLGQDGGGGGAVAGHVAGLGRRLP